MEKEFLECGQITGTHGVRGEIKVTPWGDSPEYLTKFDHFYLREGQTTLTVKRARIHKNSVLLTLEGYDTKELGDSLRGKILYIDRGDDPDPETPFIQDYFGLQVTDIDTGQDYGTISDVMITGANLVYVLLDQKNVERLIPDIPQVIIETNLEQKTMMIRPLEGLFDLEN